MGVFSLEINGQPQDDLNLYEVECHFQVNQIPTAKLNCMAKPEWVDDWPPGASATIKYKNEPVFQGLVLNQACQFTENHRRMSVNLIHDLYPLTLVHRSQLFSHCTDAEIWTTLLKEHRVDKRFKPESGKAFKHEQLLQYNCSDWTFLTTRIAANNCWLVPDREGVRITVPDIKNVRQRWKIDYKLGQQSLYDVEWEQDGQLTGAQAVVSWNLKKQEADRLDRPMTPQLWAGTLNQKTPPFTQITSCFSAPQPLDHKESQAVLDQRRSRQLATGQKVQIKMASTDESMQYRLADALTLTSFPLGKQQQESGGLITRIKYSWRKNRFNTELQLGLDEWPSPSLLLPAAPSLICGIVAPYQKKDLSDCDRIQVYLPTLGLKKEEPLWARLASIYASANGGFICYPEPGDEVLVGFFNQDPRFPVVLGAMHNPVHKALSDPCQETVKGFRFKKGGKQQKDDQDWLLDLKAQETRFRYGKTDLCMNSKGIQLNADHTIESTAKKQVLEGKTGVAIKGSQIKLDK